MNITGEVGNFRKANGDFVDVAGAFYKADSSKQNGTWSHFTTAYKAIFDASRSWSGNTSTASINTNALGSGSAISNLPSFITVKMWRRLS